MKGEIDMATQVSQAPQTLRVQVSRLPGGPQIFESILKKGQTFKDMAQQYGVSETKMREHTQQVVGAKDFSRLLKKSERTQKTINKAKESKTMRKRVTSKVSVINSNTTLTQLKMRREEAQEKLNAAIGLQESREGLLKAAKLEQQKAAEDLENAKKAFADANQLVLEVEEGLNQAKEVADNWCRQVDELDAEIKKREIYLVAPGYKGELPATGRKIAVVPMEGCELETSGVKTKITVDSSLLELFDDSMQLFKATVTFVEVVCKYRQNNVQFEMLVDDDRIVQVLRIAGVSTAN